MSVETLFDLEYREANTVEYDPEEARKTREYYHDARREREEKESLPPEEK